MRQTWFKIFNKESEIKEFFNSNDKFPVIYLDKRDNSIHKIKGEEDAPYPYIPQDVKAIKFSSDTEFNIWAITKVGSGDIFEPEYIPNFEYSLDGVTWNSWTGDYDEDEVYVFQSYQGKEFYVRGINETISHYNYDTDNAMQTMFQLEGENVRCDGNIMWLLDYTRDLTEVPDTCFRNLFRHQTALVSAPDLPGTILEPYCYFNMFAYCENLTVAPELPATELAEYCYYNMFASCTSLTEAPELPATELAEKCYYGMFKGCTSLNSITCLATNISASNCLYNWLSGVSETGTFTKNSSMTSFPTGSSGIPENWTINNI